MYLPSILCGRTITSNISSVVAKLKGSPPPQYRIFCTKNSTLFSLLTRCLWLKDLRGDSQSDSYPESSSPVTSGRETSDGLARSFKRTQRAEDSVNTIDWGRSWQKQNLLICVGGSNQATPFSVARPHICSLFLSLLFNWWSYNLFRLVNQSKSIVRALQHL